MVVGVLRLSLAIHSASSLKDKRSVLQRIKERTRQKFNVSIAEVDDNDAVDRAVLGLAVVGNDRRFVNSVVDKVQTFIDELYLAESVDSEFELISY